MLIISQMAVFFFLMILGLIARACGFITEGNRKQLVSIVVFIATPAMILSCDIRTFIQHDYSYIAWGAAVMVLVQLAQALTGLIFPPLLRVPKGGRRAVWNLLFLCTNTALLGIPMAAALFGDEATVYMSLFAVINTMLLYSYGVAILGGSGNGSLKAVLKNPNLACCMILIALILLKKPLPEWARHGLSVAGQAAPPLAMMALGATLWDVRVKEIFTDLRLLAFIILKMIAIPVFFMYLMKPLFTQHSLEGVSLIVLAAPCGVMVSMLSVLYRPECAAEASKVISATTAVAVFTIPLVALACGIAV
jgi:predicted permease